MGISEGEIKRTAQECGAVIQSVYSGESVSVTSGTGNDKGVVCPEGEKRGKRRKIKLNKGDNTA